MSERDGGARGANRPYRDPAGALVFGVCAGLADYLGQDRWRVRGTVLLLGLLFLPQVLLGYVLGAVLLKPKPPPRYENPADEEFWRTVSNRPGQASYGLQGRFRAIEGRLIDLERYVTSPAFKLNREFRDLGDKP